MSVSPDDPHAEAERWALRGRPALGREVLLRALKKEPLRRDIRRHLTVLDSTPSNLNAPRRLVPWVFSAMHVLVAWAVLVALVIGPGWLAITVVEALFPQFMAGRPGGISELVLLLVLMSVYMVGVMLVAVRMFVAFWFEYLSRLPRRHALAADEALPRVMTTWQFGAIYSDARRAFFSRPYHHE
ncbi:MAG: hypothetical protein Q4G70_14030 [Pseudomonadota bacterium]|nr:hypothetical protein [Pseudomonadota bacterium]